ncbi:MAG: HIT domain-containing protein [Planctomycetota bacterium]
MAEFQQNIWAPWRMRYIEQLADRAAGECFLCQYFQSPADDRQNHVLWRGERALVTLNRFPYSPGHLLVAPAAHGAELADLSEQVLTDVMLRIRDMQRVLSAALEAQGFNIGMNIGPCAGAGLPDHLHWHIVPRWRGDTNFMPVLADVKVMPEAMDRIHDKLQETARRLRL